MTDTIKSRAVEAMARLAAICGSSMQQCQCRSDQSDCVACTCGRAAGLITTQSAAIARLVAERDAARETALREAAKTARTVMLSGDCSAAEAHGRMAQAIACSDAILALLTKEPTP